MKHLFWLVFVFHSLLLNFTSQQKFPLLESFQKIKGAMSQGTMIVYSILLIMLYTVTRCDAVTCTSLVDCENNNSCKKEFNNGNITCRADHLCSSNCSEPIISWKVVDSEIGMLEVMFQSRQSKCKRFKITLLIDEGLNASTCNTYRGQLSKKHSWRNFSTDICKTNGRNCSGTVVMYFKYVYTGCYQFHDEYSIWKYSPIQYIETDYVKTYVEPVIFDFQYTDKSELVVKMIYPFVPNWSNFILMQNVNLSLEMPCVFSGEEHSICTTCWDNTEVFCYPTIEAAPNPECTYTGNNAYSCKFSNILPMNYCIRVEFEDEDRCQQMSIWNEKYVFPCSWATSYRAREVLSSPSVPSTSQNDNTSIIAIVLFGVICLIVLIAIIFHQNKKYKWLKSIINNPIRKQTPATYVEEFPSVVLLYARDCPLFMDSMAQFRTVLYTMGCQVYDYWDPARFDEVAESPTGWIRQHIESKEVCFVIVSTPISRLLEQTVIGGKPVVEYKEPRNFDKLFLYSLKDLEKVIINESYKRIFVVSVHNSTHTQSNALAYLNPLTVYSLPAHLDKLIHIIKNKPFEEFTDIPTVNNLPQVQEFISLIQDLEKKYGNHLDYINNIIDCV